MKHFAPRGVQSLRMANIQTTSTARPMTRREFASSSLALGAGLLAMAPRAFATAAAAESPWQIGCYTRPFDKFDWRTAFDAIAQAGYQYLGLMTTNSKQWVMLRANVSAEEARVMRDEAAKRGLKICSAYGTFNLGQTVSESVAELKKLIDNSVAAGVPNLMLGGVSEEKWYQPYYQTIAECCDYAAARQLDLSIKPHGGSNATGAQCRKAINLVGRKNFSLWYDPGNIFYYSNAALDPVDDAATVDGLVMGMSVKDFLPPKEVMVTPGAGKVDFPKVLARLKQGGFTRGPLVVECLKTGDLAQTIAEAKKARMFLEELVRKV
jgi:sugar phosphate isomerase/epimerase